MTVIVDYGVGNLFSLKSSFAAIGEEAMISSDKEEIAGADRIILPGVGAFSDAALKLKESGLDQTVINAAKNGVPLLGICLGMQLLFEKDYEYGEHDGLGLIKGNVTAIDDLGRLKIPQIGWNALEFVGSHPLFKYIKNGDHVYFVHSYAATDCEESVIAKTEYGKMLTAAVAYKNVLGCQFHPEKSGEVGLNILRAFAEMKKERV